MKTENERFHQFMMGSLLGDMSISKLDKGAKNYRASIAHSKAQACWAIFKWDFLNIFSLSGKLAHNKICAPRYKSCVEELRFKTKANSIFNYYRHLFYPNGIKIVPVEVLDLDAFGLAVWFFDDGYRTGRHLKGICLATHSFTSEGKDILLKLLRKKFNLKCSLQAEGTIYIWVESVPKFIELITPFVLPCLEYKVKGSCINRVNCKKGGDLICSQASNALEEGSETTGGIGSLNNQLERPTHESVMT